LKSLSITRNFLQKSAKISDQSGLSLAKFCPNIESLKIDYTRELDKFAENLAPLKNLTRLYLPHCTLLGSIS
jgi:hypothetical protein